MSGSVGRRVRVNHGLEHATISVLGSHGVVVALRGRSNSRGFYILGDVSAGEIRAAVDEALARLRSGESDLAIHPFCGTNLAVSGILAGSASALAARSARKGEGYPSAILAALIALLLAQPLGIWVQRHVTTLGSVGELQVVSVDRKRLFGMTLHFVRTAQ